MGKTSAELHREIAEHRSRMETRVRHLEDRVRDDVRDAGETVKHDVGERVDVKRYVEERPLTTLLGAFGAGVALGIASDKAPRVRRGGRGRRGRERAPDDGRGGGLFDELIAAASGTMSGSLRTEVKRFVDELFGERPGGRRRFAANDYAERDDDYEHPDDEREPARGVGRIQYDAEEERSGPAPFSAGTGDYRFAPGDTSDRAGDRSPLGEYDTSPYADDEGLNEYGYDPDEEVRPGAGRHRRRT